MVRAFTKKVKRHFLMLVPFPEGGGDQLPTFDVESKNAEIPKSQFQGKEVVDQLPTFDADFNNAKIPKSHFLGGGGGGLVTNFQLLIPKLGSCHTFNCQICIFPLFLVPFLQKFNLHLCRHIHKISISI